MARAAGLGGRKGRAGEKGDASDREEEELKGELEEVTRRKTERSAVGRGQRGSGGSRSHVSSGDSSDELGEDGEDEDDALSGGKESEDDEDDADGDDADDNEEQMGSIDRKDGAKAGVKEYDEYSGDDFDDSLGSEGEGVPKASGAGARLTMRQRALQGEDLGAELTKLSSPRHKKKKPPSDDLTKDEALDIKRQQKARLRNLVHEKRNKEKRAAMVDKVLRGVTSKRKKHTLATEAHVAEVGSRLAKNEARANCVRYINNREGATVSLPPNADVLLTLAGPLRVSSYPPQCQRDPKTGKRILV